MEGYAIAPASHGENKIEMDQDRKHGINSSSPSTMGSAPCEASNLVWALILFVKENLPKASIV